MSRKLFEPTKVHKVHRTRFVVDPQSQVDPTYQRAAWKRNRQSAAEERPPSSKKKSRIQFVQSSSRALGDGSSVTYQTGVRSDDIKGYSQRELKDRLRELDQQESDKKGRGIRVKVKKRKLNPPSLSSKPAAAAAAVARIVMMAIIRRETACFVLILFAFHVPYFYVQFSSIVVIF